MVILRNYNIPVISLWGLTHPFGDSLLFVRSKEYVCIRQKKFQKYLHQLMVKNLKGYQDVMRTIDLNEVIARCLEILK